MTPRKTDGEFERFEELTDVLISVPHSKIQKAEENYKKESAKNPHKRGPKPKRGKK